MPTSRRHRLVPVLCGVLIWSAAVAPARGQAVVDGGTTTVSNGTTWAGSLTVGSTGTAALAVVAGGTGTIVINGGSPQATTIQLGFSGTTSQGSALIAGARSRPVSGSALPAPRR